MARWNWTNRLGQLLPILQEPFQPGIRQGMFDQRLQHRKRHRDVRLFGGKEVKTRDIEELLPHLEARGNSAKAEAEQRLADRGRIEADAMRHILEDQRKRVADALGKPIQMAFGFEDAPPEELRQAQSNRRYWQRWLENVDGDLKREPVRILNFYTVSSFRIEPVGVAYLWPATG